MTVQQTSLEAYCDIQTLLGEKQRKVYDVIKKVGVVSDKVLSRTLNWEINRITPRRLELFRAGLIIFAGYGQENGRKVMLWKTNN